MKNSITNLSPLRTWILIGSHIVSAAALSGLLLYLIGGMENIKDGKVNFIDVLKLMLLAGGLGGILCNFRGLFFHWRDEHCLSVELEISYCLRAVTGALCGLIVYFVASLLVVSITVEQTVDNIKFQGMVSCIALALLAGFASQEFTEKLKATAITLFVLEPGFQKLFGRNKSDFQLLRQFSAVRTIIVGGREVIQLENIGYGRVEQTENIAKPFHEKGWRTLDFQFFVQDFFKACFYVQG